MIVLGELLRTLDADSQRFLRTRPTQFPVPTTCVVHSPGYYVPLFASSYRTGLYLIDGQPAEYDVVRARPGFQGTYREIEIVLVEVWADEGSGPEIYWTPVGWRFVPDFCLKFLPTTWGAMALPEPMQEHYFDLIP